MNGIEAAISEASLVESRLAVYDEALGRIRDAMARVGQKNQAIHTANHNARLLLEQLDAVIVSGLSSDLRIDVHDPLFNPLFVLTFLIDQTQLDIPTEHQHTLSEAELPGGREKLESAGAALLKATSVPLPHGLEKLGAASEQRRRLDKLRAKFSVIVARHMNNLFIHLVRLDNYSQYILFLRERVIDHHLQGNDVGETPASTTDLTLPTHQAVHRQLEPYTELMRLLRALDNKAFIQLTKVYTGTMSKLYQRDLKLFFEEAKVRVTSKKINGDFIF